MTRSVDEIVDQFSHISDINELCRRIAEAGIAEGRRQGIEEAAKQDIAWASERREHAHAKMMALRQHESIVAREEAEHAEASAIRHRSLAPPQEAAHDRR